MALFNAGSIVSCHVINSVALTVSRSCNVRPKILAPSCALMLSKCLYIVLTDVSARCLSCLDSRVPSLS